LKVSELSAHSLDVTSMAATTRAVVSPERGLPEFTAVYDHWFREVMRWARALGAPDAELEDLTQEVFLVVRRKLDGFDGRHLPAWLYRITQRTVSDYRRRSWFKNFFSQRQELALDEVAGAARTPEEALALADDRRRLQRILESMSLKRRSAFVLFEIEGYSCEEIAQLEQTSLSSVWTRVHHARKDFLARLAKLERQEGSR
jgi:RNA polymerase sigma-70 factor (ECF subfamily)